MLNNKDVYLGCPGWPLSKLDELMLELRTVVRCSGLELRFQDIPQRGKSFTKVRILKQRSRTKDSAMRYKPLKVKF
ncbi:hypothetical protein [Escherichia phage IME08]|uniref:Uncharacterized protein 30.3 n=1 Tax=Escherichia phage IME08 TaxID=698728 RepID=D7RMK7_9CAUD|nr:hypothetical protein IME08_gp193 [Escherichia phage IME08]ADI55523.1 hypothetical protein [Escherichia phage IME08]